MTWVEVAYTLDDKFDYIAFAVACRNSGVAQEFRPKDYIARITQIDALVREGATVPEAHISSRVPFAETLQDVGTCGSCGGGRVL